MQARAPTAHSAMHTHAYADARGNLRAIMISWVLQLLLRLMSQLHVARTLHVRCTYVARSDARNVARSENPSKTHISVDAKENLGILQDSEFFLIHAENVCFA